MSSILVYVQHHDGARHQNSLGVVSEARAPLASAAACAHVVVVGDSGAARVPAAVGRSTPPTSPRRWPGGLRSSMPSTRCETSPARATCYEPSVAAADVEIGRPDCAAGRRRQHRRHRRPRGGGKFVSSARSLDNSIVPTCTTAPASGDHRASRLRGDCVRRRRRAPRDVAVELALARAQATIGRAGEKAGGGVDITKSDVLVGAGRGLGGPELHIVEDAGQGARWRGRHDPRCRRRRLVRLLDPGRPDRQDRRAEALHRGRHLRRDPAQGRHAVRRARSSRSTRTRTHRSSTSPTSASSATCSRSCRSSRRSSTARKG